jgi:hypothetical protein
MRWQIRRLAPSSRVRFLIVLLVLCAAPGWARVGVVRTADGRTLEGQVRLTPQGIVIVNAVLGLISSVELTNFPDQHVCEHEDRTGG